MSRPRLLPACVPCILLFLCALIGCRSLGPEGALPQTSDWVTLPAEFEGDYFFLPLALDGDEERTLWMLYDTGASDSVIDPDSLERVSSFEREDGKRVHFDHLQCGVTHFRNMSASVRELDHIQRSVGHKLDGILGYAAFSSLLLKLDYPEGAIRVAKGTLPRPDNITVFQLPRRSRPYADFEYDGHKHDMLIDSGSGSGIDLHERSDWEWVVAPRTVGSSMGIRGLNLARAGRVSGAGLFLGVSCQQPVIHTVTDTEIMGTKVLRHFSLTFDQQERRLHVVPPMNRTIEQAPLLGTGAIFEPTRDGRRVVHVTLGSSAEKAGLQVGDKVKSTHRFTSTGHGSEGRRWYSIVRNGEQFEVAVTVEDLIPVKLSTRPVL